MKTLTTLATSLFLLFALNGIAQSDTDSEKEIRPLEVRKNEIKLGAIKLIAGPILDLEYERSLSAYSSLGGNVVINLSEDDYLTDFSISPYFRMYFSQSKEYGTKGFFAQAFMGYSSGEDSYYDYNLNVDYQENWNAFGAGLSVGNKWVNKNGFVFQILLGLGRNFISDDNADQMIFQGDIYVGYRF